MAVFEAQVFGDDRTRRKFEAIPTKLRNRTLREAFRVAGRIVKEEAEMRAPVLTGKLRAGFQVRRSERAKRGTISFVVRTGPRAYFEIPDGDPFYYPAVVEYGHPHAEKREYMAKAAESKRDSVLSGIRLRIDAAIKREAE